MEPNLLGLGWPPCSSFSALRSLDPGGPLRPKGNPVGDEAHPQVRLGNMLWRRALQLMKALVKRGVHVVLEHPASSRAWLWPETQAAIDALGLTRHRVDWCSFRSDADGGPLARKATILATDAPWVLAIAGRCPGDHTHSHLRGRDAKQAGAYPWRFCRELASSFHDHCLCPPCLGGVSCSSA